MRPSSHLPVYLRVLLPLGVFTLVSQSGEPWGFTAHRRITAAALERLPAPLARFFKANGRTLTEHAIDPDLWRAAGDLSEGPNHYINIDAVAPYPFKDVPEVEALFLEKYGDVGKNAGRLPWRIGEVTESLSRAFRAGDGEGIRREASALAHYAEDLHVPLHLTKNHDGQLTGQEGIHARWESEQIERYLLQMPWGKKQGVVEPAGDPVRFAFERIRRNYPGVDGVLASDRQAVSGAVDFFETPFDDRYSSSYFSRLNALERDRVVSAASDAAEAVAGLWLEAWHRAGRPPLPDAPRDRFVRGDTRTVLMSWDGAAEFLVERLLAEGKLPNLRRLASAGTSFDYALSTFPTKTAPAHAAIYTGATAEVSGISGNDVLFDLDGRHTALETYSGYESTGLRAEPLWVTAARQGLKAVSLHATQTYPFDRYLGARGFGANFGRDLLFFFGYTDVEASDQVYRGDDVTARAPSGWSGLPPHAAAKEFTLDVWGSTLYAVFLDTTEDPRAGYDRLLIATTKSESKAAGTRTVLAAQPAGAPAALDAPSLTLRHDEKWGAVFFRLFELSPEGTSFLLYRSKVYSERLSRPELEKPFLDAVGGFQGNDASDLYEAGAFGQTLPKGGDGVAEARYMDVLGLIYRQFLRETELALTRTDWDVLFHYLPFPDDTEHVWFGYVDPALPSFDRALASKLMPFVEEVYRWNDRLLGVILDRAPPDTLFVLASDHGIAGTDRDVLPNVALKKAGLLAVDATGKIDPHRSSIFYHPANSAYFLVNRVAYRYGIVQPEDEGQVLEAAQKTLAKVVDPETGKPLFTAFFNPLADGGTLGIGGEWGGDLYADLAYGYYWSADAAGDDVVRKREPEGSHIFLPTRPDMHAITYLAGPGVKKGYQAGPVRLIDLAPTIAYLMGIDPPRNSRGRVLEEAIDASIESPGR